MAATSSGDDVQLTDLHVIQRFSIAVRGASASREDVIAALSADLEWLRGGRRTPLARTAKPAPAKAAPARATKAAPLREAPARAAKAPVKRAAKATKSSARKA